MLMKQSRPVSLQDGGFEQLGLDGQQLAVEESSVKASLPSR